MKNLIDIKGNSQKLDGGAMFGHVPKAVWRQWMEPDKLNRIDLACRALLIKEDNRNILLEVGIGAFFEPHLRKRYGVIEPEHVLLHSLASEGLSHKDIDAVVISHLHFDHAGGLLSEYKKNTETKLLFPNARYFVGKHAWERAQHPHVRDRTSFLPYLNKLLIESKRLEIIDSETNEWLGQDYYFMFSNGHTPGLMHTIIRDCDHSPIIFASDLVPGSSWVHLPITMGYDRCAELVSDEKKIMLDYAIKHNARLFYTHDTNVISSRIARDNNGKYMAIDLEMADS
jgi:glyoxylase-like metal-dependent hydrolase (beta-lactamase superfamily II)